MYGTEHLYMDKKYRTPPEAKIEAFSGGSHLTGGSHNDLSQVIAPGLAELTAELWFETD